MPAAADADERRGLSESMSNAPLNKPGCPRPAAAGERRGSSDIISGALMANYRQRPAGTGDAGASLPVWESGDARLLHRHSPCGMSTQAIRRH